MHSNIFQILLRIVHIRMDFLELLHRLLLPRVDMSLSSKLIYHFFPLLSTTILYYVLRHKLLYLIFIDEILILTASLSQLLQILWKSWDQSFLHDPLSKSKWNTIGRKNYPLSIVFVSYETIGFVLIFHFFLLLWHLNVIFIPVIILILTSAHQFFLHCICIYRNFKIEYSINIRFFTNISITSVLRKILYWKESRNGYSIYFWNSIIFQTNCAHSKSYIFCQFNCSRIAKKMWENCTVFKIINVLLTFTYIC